MADIRIEKMEGRAVIVMSGEMTVEHARALKEAFTQSLEAAEQVIVDLEDVTDVDLACLQLLCSAHRTSVNTGKSVELKAPSDGVLSRVAGKAGYSGSFGCLHDKEHTCFWKESQK